MLTGGRGHLTGIQKEKIDATNLASEEGRGFEFELLCALRGWPLGPCLSLSLCLLLLCCCLL